MKQRYNLDLAKWVGFGSVGVLLSAAGVAQAAPYGMVYAKNHYPTFQPRLGMNSSTGTRPNKKLVYHGGPVIAAMKVYAVMWGRQVEASTQSQIGDALSAILGSTYFYLLKQYDTNIAAIDERPGTNQKFTRGSYQGMVMIEPSNPKFTFADEEVGQELEKQIGQGVLPRPDADTVFMVYFPPKATINLQGSISCEMFCGYHHSYLSPVFGAIYYSVLPDLGGACSLGCDSGPTRFDSLTTVSSHELMEMATDPAVNADQKPGYPDAWSTSRGEEIGDLCATETTRLTASDGRSYLIQQAFDNSSADCALGPFESR